MDVWDFMLCVCTLLVSVIPSCSSSCYYSISYGYRYCPYKSSSSTLGSAIGGGISLILFIVGLVLLYRFCKRRRASQGTTYTTGPSITTVTNASQSQSQFAMPNYPQQPVQQVQYPYGQPVQQTQLPYPQPQQPMAGYPNMAYNPPSYEQAAYQYKPTESCAPPMV